MLITNWKTLDETGWHQTKDVAFVGTIVINYDEDRDRMVWNVRDENGLRIGHETDLTTWGQVEDYMNIEEAKRRAYEWCFNELSHLTHKYGCMLDDLQDSLPMDIEEILQYD